MPYPEQHRYGPDKPLPSNLQIRAAAANISGNAHSCVYLLPSLYNSCGLKSRSVK